VLSWVGLGWRREREKGWGGGASFMLERLCRGELVLHRLGPQQPRGHYYLIGYNWLRGGGYRQLECREYSGHPCWHLPCAVKYSSTAGSDESAIGNTGTVLMWYKLPGSLFQWQDTV